MDFDDNNEEEPSPSNNKSLDKSIDYDLQFTKSFLDPLQVILDTIDWKAERVASLMEFFV